MDKFANKLKINFFIGNRQILKRKNPDFIKLTGGSKLGDDGSLYLDLNNEKDRIILDLIMRSEVIHIDGVVYRVLEKEFMIDGTALFISVDKIEK